MQFIYVNGESGDFHYKTEDGPVPGAIVIKSRRVVYIVQHEELVPLIEPTESDPSNSRLWQLVFNSTGLSQREFELVAESWERGYNQGQVDQRNNTIRRLPIR